ncbi:MAG: hypothetical protein Ct9H300mP28_03220 [Pseudomonadota bacterium]|nr:MAG: hypothetical protein Ct9H300mP28_03220 [Pseudomonadota bacterium]
MFGLGVWELLIVLAIVVVLFWSKTLAPDWRRTWWNDNQFQKNNEEK